MLIIQNGYECAYELRLFAEMFFDKDEDAQIFSHFEYKDKRINVYTQINFAGKAYFEDLYFDFDAENSSAQLKKKIFTAWLHAFILSRGEKNQECEHSVGSHVRDKACKKLQRA